MRPPACTLRVNWASVLEDLQAHGWSLRTIAAALGDVTEGALRKCRYGDVRHSTGERLVALWMRVTKQEREALPMSDGLDVEA